MRSQKPRIDHRRRRRRTSESMGGRERDRIPGQRNERPDHKAMDSAISLFFDRGKDPLRVFLPWSANWRGGAGRRGRVGRGFLGKLKNARGSAVPSERKVCRGGLQRQKRPAVAQLGSSRCLRELRWCCAIVGEGQVNDDYFRVDGAKIKEACAVLWDM